MIPHDMAPGPARWWHAIVAAVSDIFDRIAAIVRRPARQHVIVEVHAVCVPGGRRCPCGMRLDPLGRCPRTITLN